MTAEDVLLTACAVEETVTGLNSVVDLISASVVIDLPQAEANERHFCPAAKFDCRGRHGCGVKSESRLLLRNVELEWLRCQGSNPKTRWDFLG